MNKIRKGDEIIVLTGRDKGKRGVVALRKDDSHLVVEGINLVKKHVKPNPMKAKTAAIVEKAIPITKSTGAFLKAAPAKGAGAVTNLQPDGKHTGVSKSTALESRRAKG